LTGRKGELEGDGDRDGEHWAWLCWD
jgi:hypothetical protein